MNTKQRRKKKIFIILVVSIWFILFTQLVRRDMLIDSIESIEIEAMEQAKAQDFQGIYFNNQKIGYVINSYLPNDDQDWSLSQEALIKLNVSGSKQIINLNLQAKLTKRNKLKSFSFSFKSPFYKMAAKGTVTNNQVNYTLDTGTNNITDTVSFSTPPLLATGRRKFLLDKDIEIGKKIRVPIFDPFSLTGRESILTYKGKDSVQINGRIHNLHHFTQSYHGVRINSWLNDSGVVVKEESPAGFIFLKEPKFKALSQPGQSDELLSSLAIKPTQNLPPEKNDMRQFRLDFADENTFSLNSSRQEFSDGILTIKKETIPTTQQQPSCEGFIHAQQPGPYIQSDDNQIQQVAKSIVDSSDSPFQKIQKLGKWVYDNLEKRPVLGLPDAVTTLNSKTGDCNEHAVLFASLARAVKLPTRIVAGVTYHQDGFYYHAWNEVCVGRDWISIDTTTNQLPADLTHIRFLHGGIKEQIKITALLGRLSIEPIPIEN